MATTDWKDALSALAGELPPDGDAGETAVQPQPTDSADGLPAPQRLTIVFERKGRKGKPATIITGFDCPDAQVARLLTWLQTRLGRGGSSRGGEILLQGDCRDKLPALLRQLNHKVNG